MALAVICVIFFGLALAGMPLVWSLLVTTIATILILDRGYPIEAVLLTFVGGVEPLHLAAIPLFICAGQLISRGGVGRRLIDFARTLFSFLPGGLGVVTVSSCTLFSAVSGSSVADAAAVGSVMIPGMVERGYSRAYAAALVAVAGTLGIIIPPSIQMLVYAFVGGVSVAELFLSGVVPGLLFAAGMIAVCIWKSRSTGVDPGGERPDWRAAGRAFVESLPALLMPVLILGGIYSGVFTPTESAAVAVVYGLLIALLLYREIGLADVPRIVLDSFITSAIVMLVVGATAALAWLITVEQVPVHLTALMSQVATSKWMFLLILNVALLAIGIFLEPLPALLLTAPLFIPTAKAFGVDPVHLGLIMTCNLAIGLYTPPVGGTLFVAARIANVGIGAVSRELGPLFLVGVAVLMLVTYVEWLPMGLVWLFR